MAFARGLMDGAERADRSHADTYRLCQVGGERRINGPNQVGKNRWGGTQPTPRCSSMAVPAQPHAGAAGGAPSPSPASSLARLVRAAPPAPAAGWRLALKS